MAKDQGKSDDGGQRKDDFRSIKSTECKTVTNTEITRDRHGVTRHEVRRERN